MGFYIEYRGVIQSLEGFIQHREFHIQWETGIQSEGGLCKVWDYYIEQGVLSRLWGFYTEQGILHIEEDVIERVIGLYTV